MDELHVLKDTLPSGHSIPVTWVSIGSSCGRGRCGPHHRLAGKPHRPESVTGGPTARDLGKADLQGLRQPESQGDRPLMEPAGPAPTSPLRACSQLLALSLGADAGSTAMRSGFQRQTLSTASSLEELKVCPSSSCTTLGLRHPPELYRS